MANVMLVACFCFFVHIKYPQLPLSIVVMNRLIFSVTAEVGIEKEYDDE